MCGIAGFISGKATPERRLQAVDRMCDAMLRRGPDDAGSATMGPATIGMRRLAIFDPANGHQPMQTADGRVTLVFNGAIYNFAELRAQLTAAGFSFKTHCDTEVLLAAYAHWGQACVSRLRGMFAFAAWDAAAQSLFLARDPFGIKPLYYATIDDGLLFASELNALRASGEFHCVIDSQAIVDYLGWFSVPSPRTIYTGACSLKPGECAVWKSGKLLLTQTWSFSTRTRHQACTSRQAFTSELRARLEDTTKAHVLADVPVGAFLSGGLDSAVITSLMSRAAGSKMKSFSIVFDEQGFSEDKEACETAAFIGTDHHSFRLTGGQIANDLPRILAAMDQPTGDGINTYYASQAARAGGVTVALSGLGGDELFGGYPSFRDLPRIHPWLRCWSLLPEFLRSTVTSRLNKGDTRRRKLADFLTYARNLNELGALQRRVFSEAGQRSLLSPDLLGPSVDLSPFHPQLDQLSADLVGSPDFEVLSAWELRTYMADVLLRDSDVMSMQHSLELRVPFIDRPFVEWLWSQPVSWKYDRSSPKSPLAAAVSDLLPPALLTRKKRGFSLPFPVWMKSTLRPFLQETFSTSSLAQSGLFHISNTQDRWNGFLKSDDQREWSRLWSLAVLIHFVNRRP